MSKKSKMIRKYTRTVLKAIDQIEFSAAGLLQCVSPQQILKMKVGRGKRFVQFSLVPGVPDSPEFILQTLTTFIKVRMGLVMCCPPISWETLSDRSVQADASHGPLWSLDVVHFEDTVTVDLYFNVDEA